MLQIPRLAMVQCTTIRLQVDPQNLPPLNKCPFWDLVIGIFFEQNIVSFIRNDSLQFSGRRIFILPENLSLENSPYRFVMILDFEFWISD